MPKKNVVGDHQAATWSAAIEAVLADLEAFKGQVARKRRRGADVAILVGDLCEYWENWRSEKGAFAVALFAWSHRRGVVFRGGEVGALRAFAKLALDLDDRRASEFAKLMGRVLTKATPAQAAAAIAEGGGARVLARRIHTRDDPKDKKVAKRIKASKQPLKRKRLFAEKGGDLLPARAKRDTSSYCQSALIYDDLRRLLRLKLTSKGKALVAADQDQLDGLVDRWNEIECPNAGCSKAVCEFARLPKWLSSKGYANLYGLVDELGEQRIRAARSAPT